MSKDLFEEKAKLQTKIKLCTKNKERDLREWEHTFIFMKGFQL